MNLNLNNLEEVQKSTHIICPFYALSLESIRLEFHRQFIQFDNIYFVTFASLLGPSKTYLLPTSQMIVCFNNIFIYSPQSSHI